MFESKCSDCQRKLGKQNNLSQDHDCMWKTRWESLNKKLTSIQSTLRNKIYALKQDNSVYSDERAILHQLIEQLQKDKEELSQMVLHQQKSIKKLASLVGSSLLQKTKHNNVSRDSSEIMYKQNPMPSIIERATKTSIGEFERDSSSGSELSRDEDFQESKCNLPIDEQRSATGARKNTQSLLSPTKNLKRSSSEGKNQRNNFSLSNITEEGPRNSDLSDHDAQPGGNNPFGNVPWSRTAVIATKMFDSDDQKLDTPSFNPSHQKLGNQLSCLHDEDNLKQITEDDLDSDDSRVKTDSDDAEFASLEGIDVETLDDKKKLYIPVNQSHFKKNIDQLNQMKQDRLAKPKSIDNINALTIINEISSEENLNTLPNDFSTTMNFEENRLSGANLNRIGQDSPKMANKNKFTSQDSFISFLECSHEDKQIDLKTKGQAPEEAQAENLPKFDARFSTLNTLRELPSEVVRDFGSSLVNENLLFAEKLEMEDSMRDTVRETQKNTGPRLDSNVTLRRGKTTISPRLQSNTIDETQEDKFSNETDEFLTTSPNAHFTQGLGLVNIAKIRVELDRMDDSFSKIDEDLDSSSFDHIGKSHISQTSYVRLGSTDETMKKVPSSDECMSKISNQKTKLGSYFDEQKSKFSREQQAMLVRNKTEIFKEGFAVNANRYLLHQNRSQELEQSILSKQRQESVVFLQNPKQQSGITRSSLVNIQHRKKSVQVLKKEQSVKNFEKARDQTIKNGQFMSSTFKHELRRESRQRAGTNRTKRLNSQGSQQSETVSNSDEYLPSRTKEQYMRLKRSICNPMMTKKHATMHCDVVNFSQLASKTFNGVKRTITNTEALKCKEKLGYDDYQNHNLAGFSTIASRSQLQLVKRQTWLEPNKISQNQETPSQSMYSHQEFAAASKNEEINCSSVSDVTVKVPIRDTSSREILLRQNPLQLTRIQPPTDAYPGQANGTPGKGTPSKASAKILQNVAGQIGQQIGSGLKAISNTLWRNFVAKPRDLENDLEWFQKQISVQNLPSKAYFEKYVVAGVETAKIQDMLRSGMDQGYLQPKTLLAYPQKAQCGDLPSLFDDDLVHTIADFCFPSGVLVQQIDYDFGKDHFNQSEEIRELLEEILYRQKSNIRENMFFFTINGFDAAFQLKESGEFIYSVDDAFFKCLCVVFNDLVIVDETLFSVQKAVCVVTTNAQYFGLIQEMISWNFEMLKIARINRLIELHEEIDYDEQQRFSLEVMAYSMVIVEQPHDEVYFLLDMLRFYKQRNGSESQIVQVQDPSVGGQILEFKFPRSLINCWLENLQLFEDGCRPQYTMDDLQFELIEYHWYLPTVLSLFSPKTFCKLLTAILLERSIVIVEDNLAIITSIVLALKTIIRPFQWCNCLVPALPSGLQDTIFQPFSILLGMTSYEYSKLLKTTTTEDRNNITWIFLNCKDAETFIQEEDLGNSNFEGVEKDCLSGACILWSFLDGDFQDEQRSKLMLGWCSQLYKDTKPFFEAFTESAINEFGQQQVENRTTGGAAYSHNEKNIFVETTEIDSPDKYNSNRTDRINSTATKSKKSLSFENSAVKTRNTTRLFNTDSFLGRPNGNSPILLKEKIPDIPPPVVLVPNFRQKEQIDMIVLHVAKALKAKVIDLIPLMCTELDYRETELAFECTRMAHVLGKLAKDPRDVDFLEKFAFTQMFSLMVEKYIDSLQTQVVSTEPAQANF